MSASTSANIRRHHLPLALAGFIAHHGPGSARALDGPVLGVVVVDVNNGLRQRGAEVPHHVPDGGLLVVAGQDHRHAIALVAEFHVGFLLRLLSDTTEIIRALRLRLDRG